MIYKAKQNKTKANGSNIWISSEWFKFVKNTCPSVHLFFVLFLFCVVKHSSDCVYSRKFRTSLENYSNGVKVSALPNVSTFRLIVMWNISLRKFWRSVKSYAIHSRRQHIFSYFLLLLCVFGIQNRPQKNTNNKTNFILRISIKYGCYCFFLTLR